MGKGAGNCLSSPPEPPAASPAPQHTAAPAPAAKPAAVAQKPTTTGKMVKIAVIYYSSECARVVLRNASGRRNDHDPAGNSPF